MEGYVSEVSNHADLESAVTAATSDTLGQLRAFQETYNKYADNLDLAKSAESSRKTQNDSPVSRKTSVNPMGYQAEYTAAGRRKLTGSFTCSPAFAAFSPWSMCSDVVDYPFLLLDTDTLQDLETAVRAAVPSTHAFMDNACLSDYKRMICAQVYLPCVDGVISGDPSTYDSVTSLPHKLPCDGLCTAASSAGSTCSGLLEALGVSMPCSDALQFDTNAATCNALTSTASSVTVAPHKEPYIGAACTGFVTETHLGDATAMTIPGLPPLLPPWVQQSLIEMTTAPIFDATPMYFTPDCLKEERHFYCNLKYMAPQEMTDLAYLFGSETAYMGRFPNQAMCQSFMTKCAAAVTLATPLAMDCATEVAPSTPLFPETSVILGTFPGPSGTILLQVTANDALSPADTAMSPEVKLSVTSQCPHGFSTNEYADIDPARYNYMMGPAMSPCKYSCPNILMFSQDQYDGYVTYTFACTVVLLLSFIAVICNMYQQDSEKRNNYVLNFSWYQLVNMVFAMLFLIGASATGSDGYMCENDVTLRNGSWADFAGVFEIPVALTRYWFSWGCLLTSTCLSMEVWLRVYWKIKNIKTLRRVYTAVISVVLLSLGINGLVLQLIDENTGEPTVSPWVLSKFIDCLPFPNFNWGSDALWMDYNVPFIVCWVISTSIGAHMLYYCVSISLTAMRSTGTENPLYKLWKTYSTLITLMVIYQLQTVALAVLQLMYQVLFPAKNHKFQVKFATEYIGCIISTFKNTSVDPTKGVAGCGLKVPYELDFSLTHLFNYLYITCTFGLFYATYNKNAADMYWSACPAVVQDLLLKYVFVNDAKVQAMPVPTKDLEGQKAIELAKKDKPMLGGNEESKGEDEV
jgi:hypothetical protein